MLKDNIGEAEEAAVNLTTAGTVVFNMRAAGGGAVKINRAVATITDAAAGEVTYSWGTADVDTVGDYEAEMEAIWADAKKETFPNGADSGKSRSTTTSHETRTPT